MKGSMGNCVSHHLHGVLLVMSVFVMWVISVGGHCQAQAGLPGNIDSAWRALEERFREIKVSCTVEGTTIKFVDRENNEAEVDLSKMPADFIRGDILINKTYHEVAVFSGEKVSLHSALKACEPRYNRPEHMYWTFDGQLGMYMNESKRLHHANGTVADRPLTLEDVYMPGLRVILFAHRPRTVVQGLIERGGSIEVANSAVRQGATEYRILKVNVPARRTDYELWLDPSNEFQIMKLMKRLGGEDALQVEFEYKSGRLSGASRFRCDPLQSPYRLARSRTFAISVPTLPTISALSFLRTPESPTMWEGANGKSIPRLPRKVRPGACGSSSGRVRSSC